MIKYLSPSSSPLSLSPLLSLLYFPATILMYLGDVRDILLLNGLPSTLHYITWLLHARTHGRTYPARTAPSLPRLESRSYLRSSVMRVNFRFAPRQCFETSKSSEQTEGQRMERERERARVEGRVEREEAVGRLIEKQRKGVIK